MAATPAIRVLLFLFALSPLLPGALPTTTAPRLCLLGVPAPPQHRTFYEGSSPPHSSWQST